MADPGGQSLQQQAFRQQYESQGTGYSQQQQFYHPYGFQYQVYPAHMSAPQYHQPMHPQQWAYYNANPYARAQAPYHNYRQYQYAHSSHYQARTSGHHHQTFHSPTQARTESLAPQASHAQSVPPPLQVPPTPPLDPRPLQSPVPSVSSSGHRAPYYPPLPWLSVPHKPFPPKQRRCKRHPRPQSSSRPVELPARSQISLTESEEKADTSLSPHHASRDLGAVQEHTPVDEVKVKGISQQPTKASGITTHLEHVEISKPGVQSASKVGVVVPVVPNITPFAKPTSPEVSKHHPVDLPKGVEDPSADHEALQSVESSQISKEPEPKTAAKSWAELLKKSSNSGPVSKQTNDIITTKTNDSLHRRHEMLGHAIASFAIDTPEKLAFLEPRGLINSGNMCYMNSILQALVSCVPFYNFLLHVSRHAVYSFKSDTPLLDALIMFMKEFNIIDSAESAEKLRMRLKPLELEQYGDSLLPEYVYEEIRRMPRFATMQRGHQQDAEEFLGFLFEELQGECTKAIRRASIPEAGSLAAPQSEQNVAASADDEGWLEVGPKQKAATTRSSGAIDVDTPINRIFGGQLRSELRIPGAKNSVTLEPYQSLQLDVGSPDVHTITDALKGLTKPETLHGDFQSPRGAGATATKQVFIEALPPVLILHLKRFQYDNAGGTQKVWKHIGYPLQLEIPKEAFPHSKRGSFAVRGGTPKYRLISVVYHHGKSATAGHYTTDILRQDGKEWLRIDDTFIRRVRSHEVESAGEDTSKALAMALEAHHRDTSESQEALDDEKDEKLDLGSGKGWSQARPNGKKWSNVANGTAKSSGGGTPIGAHSLKDNRVAYILFYEKIEV